VGTFSQPDFEKIISLKPDIIFATGLEQALTVAKLKKLKLNICVSDPSNIDELFDSIKEIGEIVGREKEAEILVVNMKKRIKDVSGKSETLPHEKRPKVFIEFWDSPLMSAGKNSFIDELIYLAGGRNIAADVPRAYSYFSPEQVIERNPDFIFLSYMGDGKSQDEVKNRLGWAEIEAVKNNRIYSDIDASLLLRPGPRLVDGLEEMHKRLYPDEI